MLQARGDHRLADESPARGRVVVVQLLDRDRAIEDDIASRPETRPPAVTFDRDSGRRGPSGWL